MALGSSHVQVAPRTLLDFFETPVPLHRKHGPKVRYWPLPLHFQHFSLALLMFAIPRYYASAPWLSIPFQWIGEGCRHLAGIPFAYLDW